VECAAIEAGRPIWSGVTPIAWQRAAARGAAPKLAATASQWRPMTGCRRLTDDERSL